MQDTRYDLKPVDLRNEKFEQVTHLYIEMRRSYIVYAAKYFSQIPIAENKDDHSMGWKQTFSDFHIKIKRASLVALDISFLDHADLWCVMFESNGYPYTVKLYFETEAEARDFHKVLDEFIFSN